MDEALKRQSEELEQTLRQQLGLLKQDSGVYLKVGGIALISGLLAVGATRIISGRNKSKKPGKRLKGKKKQKYSILRNIRNRFFWMAVDYGKSRLLEQLVAKASKEDEPEH
ncbi:hypothetical protein SAMN04488057_101323 [Cyclobacterium lianum]|uniref:Uncharacterized protein n=1 Tax=Cyclobacterium lianum TaxID=388280 RepID=A0A1M7IGJ6_9BACT|nr:hypothetical protein [Cyclobacterium lianum]SHM39904.1 hypothetical protein SAMN04488057_101323 [Cyclobacterium lianum]